MAKETTVIVVSDLSGERVPEGESATVRMAVPSEDAVYIADLTKAEAEILFEGITFRVQKMPGRPKADTNGGAEPEGPTTDPTEPEAEEAVEGKAAKGK